MEIHQLPEQFLLQLKKHEPAGALPAQLAALPFIRLAAALDTDERKKAFWINAYNAFFLFLRREQGVAKPGIFRRKLITLAGRPFSLDDIEHGILRKYRFKWSLGYLPDPFAPPVVRRLAVSKTDYRIHFALNCGAASCPPIAFYTPEQLDRQLDLATHSFLEGETKVFPGKKEIHISRLFRWYLGDFGGHSGIRRILEQYLAIETAGWKLVYRSYDWTEQLDHFVPG